MKSRKKSKVKSLNWLNYNFPTRSCQALLGLDVDKSSIRQSLNLYIYFTMYVNLAPPPQWHNTSKHFVTYPITFVTICKLLFRIYYQTQIKITWNLDWWLDGLTTAYHVSQIGSKLTCNLIVYIFVTTCNRLFVICNFKSFDSTIDSEQRG